MILLALLLAQAPAAPAAPAQTPPPPAPVTWSGTVGLGMIALTGNSQALTFSTNFGFERKGPEWIWGIKGYGAYGQTTPTSPPNSAAQTTALNAGLLARGDRRFSDVTSVYVMTGVDTDHLKDIESRPFGEVGISLLWWDEKQGDFQKSMFRTDLGFRYGREYRFHYYGIDAPERADPSEVDVVAPRIGALLRYAINKDVIFTDEISALGNVVGTARLLLTNTAKLATHLTDKVGLGISFVVNEDTVPPPGKVNADTALTVGLEVGI